MTPRAESLTPAELKRLRSGVAVYLVVMVCAIISVFIVILGFFRRDTSSKGRVKREAAQATYLAKGAQNHFLLKYRLLQREFYDAMSYSVGRNPHFDWQMPITSISGNTFTPQGTNDNGPMFFTGTNAAAVTLVGTNAVADRSGEGAGLYSNGAANFGDNADNRPVMAFMLNHFLLDVATDYPRGDGQGVVVVRSTPHAEVAQMGVADGGASSSGRVEGWADPFNGTYHASSAVLFSEKAQGSTRRFENMSVAVTTQASVMRDKQVSVVTRSGNALRELIVHQATKGKLETGAGWVESKDEKMSAEELRALQSGQRTQEVTGIYMVHSDRKP